VSRGACRSRRGLSLVELLVALPLAALAAACAAVLLVRSAAVSRTAAATLSASRELRHAARLATDDLSALDGRSLVSWTDTLLEYHAQVGVAVACSDAAGTTIDVATGGADDDAAWLATLRAGDLLHSWSPAAEPGAPPAAVDAVVTGPAVALTRGTCGEQADVRRWRLALGTAVSAFGGAPVLVRRRTRLQHYRSGSEWWLGRRTRDAAGWEVMQPVAGPLRSAAMRGMEVEALDTRGVITAVADSIAQLRIRLRGAPPRGAPHVRDSAEILVPLQGAIWRRPR
jgi:type II secretory pathway pseudopilin PulG